jgi:hypothetical protein
VAEWSNVLDSKSSVGATLPRVRIPPSPPTDQALKPIGLRAFVLSLYVYIYLPICRGQNQI